MNPDDGVPGGVYLCQISETISCGACCGLYNVADLSFDHLSAMLRYRTETFARVPRTMDAILAFKAHIEEKENQNRPFPDFHHCPYIGLIGENFARVGCLLHPLGVGNKGIDFRGLSYHGGLACGMYFCPSYRILSEPYKKLIRKSAYNWYSYGLMIGEANSLIEEKIYSPMFEATRKMPSF